MRNKPALKVLIPFAAGIFSSRLVATDMRVYCVALVCLTLAAAISHVVRRHAPFALFAALALTAAGAIRHNQIVRFIPFDHISRFTDGKDEIAVEGRLVDPVTRRKKFLSFRLEVDSLFIDSKAMKSCGCVSVRLYDLRAGLRYGDVLVLKGYLRSPAGARNPGEFDYARYCAARGIHAILSVYGENRFAIVARNRGYWVLLHAVMPVRRFIQRLVDFTLSGQSAALLQGLLIADKGRIDTGLLDAFSNVGVIHVLAVSGLHVGFVLFGLVAVLKTTGLAPVFRTTAVVLGLIFYTLLTGAHAPVVRATTMAAVVLYSPVVQRPVQIFNSVAFAALVILFVNPPELFEAGFQLSFTAVLGIVLIYRRLSDCFQTIFLRWRERGSSVRLYLGGLLLVSVSAQLATLPLTVYYFGRIPLVAFAANLLVVPLVAIIVAVGFIAVVSAAVYWPAGVIYAHADWLFVSILISVVKSANRLPFSHIRIFRPSPLLCLCYFSVLLLFVFWRKPVLRRRLVWSLAVLCCATVWYSAATANRGLLVTFFDVGQGDATLFEFPDNKTLLVDAGDSQGDFDCGESVVAPYLERRGIKTIDALVITHAHSDHIGGVPYLLQNTDVRRVVMSGVEYPSFVSTRVDSLIAVRGIRRRIVSAGDTLCGFPALILIFHPTDGFVRRISSDPSAVNDASVVFRLIYGDFSFLLTGDAEHDSEIEMSPFGGLLHSDVLKVAHHGSATASSDSFRRLVAPDYAIVQVARFNRFGLPSPTVCRCYREEGAELIRTCDNGAVVFFTDGCTLKRRR